jgi:outer membrane protein OmpA-like peptidoglycan-associated protein
MERSRMICAYLMAGALLLNACASMNKTAKGGLLGAAGGAAVGAAWGAARGDAAKGALIGAAVGGASGAVVGAIIDKQEKEMKEAGIQAQKQEDNTLLVTMTGDSLKFDTGKSTVSPEGVAQLNKLGGILKKYPENRIIVEGHTDNVGNAASNKALSLDRAESVKNQFLVKGVPQSSILSCVGFGQSQPVADNKTAAGRAQNRRVVLKISVEEESK